MRKGKNVLFEAVHFVPCLLTMAQAFRPCSDSGETLVQESWTLFLLEGRLIGEAKVSFVRMKWLNID